jgi:acyl-CoA synthetase (AMP-forming)/AMP-acid ligase II
MISHLNSLTFVNWCFDEFRVCPQDQVSSHAPFHFDLSVFDIFCTIKAGGTVFLVPQEIAAFPVRLAQWIAEKEITIWYSVPSALIQLVEHGKLEQNDYAALRTVLFAGEVFPIKYLRRLMAAVPHPSYYNLYGPTETNVCTYYRVQPADIAPERAEAVPIGKACANTEVVAVNDEGRPAEAGGAGELYVRSSTVMKGYWGRPEASSQCVIPNFLNPHYRDVLYKTGDLVRQMPSGDYIYLGRRDKMIKSRGYRIELGEIEAALYAHPGVREAAVIAIPDELVGARIKAYVVVHNGLQRTDLERFCLLRLPRYMMPERIEFRAELPRTSTGKVDKTSLEKEKPHVA